MANVFDQFDKPKSNAFDRFDGPQRINRPRPQREVEKGVTHPEFDASGIPGFNTETGMVEPGANNSWMDKLGAFSAGVLEGVPIAGPYLLEGVQRLGSDDGKDLYAARQATERAQRDNPWTSLAGNVTGAVAGTLPAIAAAPELFGGGAASLPIRSAVSAITGGGIGGADAAVRSSGDPGAMATGALAGAGAGLAGPAIGQVAGNIGRRVIDYFGNRSAAVAAGTTQNAAVHLRRALEADGLTPVQVNQRLADLGQDAMLADVGPNLQQTAAGLVAKPGEARAVMQNAMRERDAGANARIRSTLDAELGPAPIPSRIETSIRDNQRALSPAYEAAFRNARAVDTQPLAETLDSAIVNLRGEAQTAARSVRRMLNIEGTDQLDPHPGALFQTRQAIDGMLDDATDGNVRRILTQARQAVDDQLTRSVPGIKDVDARFAELARQERALERGQTVFDSGRGTPIPQELAEEVQQASLPQGRLIGPSAVPVRLREGARAEIERIVGTNANDRVALQRLIKGEGDWNPQKLATLFGPEKARRVLQVLDAEKTFADTSDFVTRNSFTAARTEAVKALDGNSGRSGIREGFMYGGASGAARSVAVTGMERVAQALAGLGDADRAAMARALSSPNVAAIVQALKVAQKPSKVPEHISAMARALALASATAPSGR